ncbi:hypothetical protein JEQ12_014516 [Ovis aries]|uniref:Uncharacterized protein n=1 Tax=Ovis aries TaxID=9940 RepID=A0A836AA90_SHEEP|nr:hypothetical protein JEQ12_014516 [Ovis aries]
MFYDPCRWTSGVDGGSGGSLSSSSPRRTPALAHPASFSSPTSQSPERKQKPLEKNGQEADLGNGLRTSSSVENIYALGNKGLRYILAKATSLKILNISRKRLLDVNWTFLSFFCCLFHVFLFPAIGTNLSLMQSIETSSDPVLFRLV